MADLTIKINGDVKNFTDSLDSMKSSTDNFGQALQGVADLLVFKEIASGISKTVELYREQELATNDLVSALQQQGIYTGQLADQYKSYADEIAAKTGIDANQIVQGEALLQSQIGQTKITRELTQAVVDLAARKKLDLASAFDLVAKAANGNMAILKRYNIVVEDGSTRAQNLANLLKPLQENFGGSAEAAAQGLGVYGVLKEMFRQIAEQIGSEFAPALTLLGEKLSEVLTYVKEHPEVVKLATSIALVVSVIGLAATGFGAAAVALGFFRQALISSGIAAEGMALSLKGLLGATGIGLLLILVTDLALHWNSAWPVMKATFEAFVTSTMDLVGGFGKILKGAFTLDTDLLKAGLEQVKSALKDGVEQFNTILQQGRDANAAQAKVDEDKKLAANNKGAAAAEARRRDLEARKKAAKDAEIAVRLAQANEESKAVIEIKTKEASILKEIADDNNKAIRKQLEAHYRDLKTIEAQAHDDENKNNKAYSDQILKNSQEYNALSAQDKKLFLLENSQALKNSLQSDDQVRQQYALQEVQKDIQTQNTLKLNAQRFGQAYAQIFKVMHSETFQGFQTAGTELANLQNSNNATLKGIGKVFAVSDVTIKTAQSAMNIYEGFSTIPIVGPELGIAAAAAAIAYGGEQIANIVSANTGGLIPGGGANKDSVLSFLTPGELVVPRSNFDEVVSSVSAQRSASAGGPGLGGSGGGAIELTLKLKDSLMDFIEVQTVRRRNLNISYVGA